LSLKLDKFKGSALKREQMFTLNGDGMRTDPGHATDNSGGRCQTYDYSYDSQRSNGSGGTFITYHGRSNVRNC
jgi:hypothetical protein